MPPLRQCSAALLHHSCHSHNLIKLDIQARHKQSEEPTNSVAITAYRLSVLRGTERLSLATLSDSKFCPSSAGVQVVTREGDVC